MANRIEKLNRLRIASPCGESWDGMAGGAERRHCAKCDREVFDFARMTPRQIEVRIEASGGRLCARLTRGADGLVTLPPPEPPPFWFERRASPVASALVTALLGFGSAAAGAALEAPPASATPSGLSTASDAAKNEPKSPVEVATASSPMTRIDGVVTDQAGEPLPGATVTIQEADGGRKFVQVSDAEGRFRFENVAPGTAVLAFDLEGFLPITFPDLRVSAGRTASVEAKMEPQVEGGILAFTPAESLRQVYGESELVVTGVVGATRPTDPKDPLEKETEIRVTSVLKGRYAGRTLFVTVGRENDEKPIAPGARVLAFLEVGDPRPGHKVSYVSTDLLRGPQTLSDEELAAYAARLDALERISRRGAPGPAALAAWLVSTVEEPATRKEATGELSRALAALAEIAEEREIPVEQATSDLRAEVALREAEGKKFDDDEALRRAGAFVSEADKNRLIRALLATESLSQGDLDLYGIVRPWANDKAVEWLTRRFREVEPADGNASRDAMGRLAEALDSDSLKALLKASDDDLESYLSSQSEETLNDTDRLEAEFAARQKELRQRFLAML
jgi:hypothetical protein